MLNARIGVMGSAEDAGGGGGAVNGGKGHDVPEVDFASAGGGEDGGGGDVAGEDGEGFAVVFGGHVVGVVPEDLGSFYFHALCVLMYEMW